MRGRVAIFSSHPIPYFVPFFRELASSADVEPLVLFGDDYGGRPRKSGWGVADFTWANGILEGYPYRFLRNWAPKRDPSTFAGKINPDLLLELARLRPDAVLVTGYASIYHLQALAGAMALGTGLIYLADTASRRPASNARTWVKRRIVRQLFRRVDAFLTIGSSNRRHYRSFGVPEQRMFAFPYAVDNKHFAGEAARLGAERASLRARFGITPGATCVMFSGRLSAEKNVEELVRGVQRAPGMHLLVVGSGPERPALERLARELLPGRHTFAGFMNQDRLGEAYVAADVLALTSKLDAWGLVCNEAMNFGLPLVLSDHVGAAEDLVLPGKTGWVYPVGETEALAAALRAADHAVRTDAATMAAVVKAHVDRYDARAQLEGFLRALRSVMESRGRARRDRDAT